jgi:AcrR family transcriptional regulator
LLVKLKEGDVSGDTAEHRAGAARRRARGQRRMAEILEAAARVFAAQGFEGASTNAIAAEAGVSPGSLYQYFKDKEEIAFALAERYVAELEQAQDAAFEDDAPPAGLVESVRSVIAPLVAFNVANPGFKALFARTDMPPALAQAVLPIHDRIHRRVRHRLDLLLPTVPADELDRVATVAVQMVRGLMPLIVAASTDERAMLTAELEAALTTYLGEVARRPGRG